MAKNTVKSIVTPSHRQHPAERLLTSAKREEVREVENTPVTQEVANNDLQENIKPAKNKGGRPKKENKKQQFSITMDPELYKKVKEYAETKRTSFSQLMVNAVLEYMEHDNE